MDLYPILQVILYILLLGIILPFFCIFNFFLGLYRYFSIENVKGKVVLITGASSGIGEQMAYEYARRGASLVIVARRENLLKKVAQKARELGCCGVLPICGDVQNADDCKRFVDEAIKHFGRLDHVVNNAGLFSVCPIEEASSITAFQSVMNVNFWGSVYPSYFAVPHLKKTKGKIFVSGTAATYLHPPKLNVYTASKAAIVNFCDSLRVELGPEISITTAILGLIDSEMTRGKILSKDGNTEIIDKDSVNSIIEHMPVISSSDCAKTLVDAVCRKQRSVVVPKWYKFFFLANSICPELLDWIYDKGFSRKEASRMPSSVPTSQNNKAD